MRTDSTTAKWRRSSHSGGTGNCVEIAHVVGRVEWRKSSRSGQNGECVEIADVSGYIAVRDGKAPDAGHLAFAPRAWAAFMAEARAGRYDR